MRDVYVRVLVPSVKSNSETKVVVAYNFAGHASAGQKPIGLANHRSCARIMHVPARHGWILLFGGHFRTLAEATLVAPLGLAAVVGDTTVFHFSQSNPKGGGQATSLSCCAALPTRERQSR